MKKLFNSCLLILSLFVMFSCSNLLSDSSNYGELSLILPSFNSARAAENINSLEFTVAIKNRDTNAEIQNKGFSGQEMSFELEPGFYSIKIAAYYSSTPEEILYEGEASNVEIIAGKTTSTSITLKYLDNAVIGKDGTIRLSKIARRFVLKPNVWGETDYSELQTDTINLTQYFKGKLPVAGQTLKFYYKGTINIDANNLYMGLVDIAKFEDGHEEWHAIVSDDKIHTPVATNVKANQEFEINVSFTLEADVKNTLQLTFCCGTEGRDISPAVVELEEDVVKITPPSELYLSALVDAGCDGYTIGVASGETPEGWKKWLFGNKVHLTDADAFQDVDFTIELSDAHDLGLIEDETICPGLIFYKNVDFDDNRRIWLDEVYGENADYNSDDKDGVRLSIEEGKVQITPPGSAIFESLKNRGCDGYVVGIIAGKLPNGNDNWICSRRVLLENYDTSFKNIDFSAELPGKQADIINANGEIFAIIDFYKDIDSGENNRKFLWQYKSEVTYYEIENYNRHISVNNVSNGIQVTLRKYENDPQWQPYNAITFKEDDEDLGIEYSYTYSDNCVIDAFGGTYSFIFPFTTEGKKYTFTINPYEGRSETVNLVAENTSEIQLQNLGALGEFKVTYTEKDDEDLRTVKINMNPLDIFTDSSKLAYANLCVNAYTPYYDHLNNFQGIDVLMAGFNIMYDSALWPRFVTKLQDHDKIIFNSNVEFSVESHYDGDGRPRGAFIIDLGHEEADWTQPSIISFETNGGTLVESIGIPNGETIYYYWYSNGSEINDRTTYFNKEGNTFCSMIPVPTMEGKEFYGWYLDSDLSTEATTPFPVNGSKTLYAKWVEPCTINFVTYCDISIPSITVPSGRSYFFGTNGSDYELRIDGNNCIYRLSNNNPNYPRKAGYTLTGWYMDSGFSVPAFEQSRKFNATANGEITLYAKWD